MAQHSIVGAVGALPFQSLDVYVAARELAGAVDLACAIGALAPDPARRAQALAVRVKRMLRALSR